MRRDSQECSNNAGSSQGTRGASLALSSGVNLCKFAKVIAIVLFAVCCPLSSYAADLTLEWDPPSDGVTRGYFLLYGTAPHSYSQQVDVGNTTSYAVKNLLDGTTYYFAVRAYDAAGETSDPSLEVSGTTARAVPRVVTALALTANVAPPQVAGTTITWLSTAAGGVAPYQFQWGVYRAGQWTVGPWTVASTWTWTPSAPGSDYQVRVAVRSSGSSSTLGELVQSVPFTVTAPRVASVTLQPNVTPPQTVGNAVRWSAAASGVTTGYEYRWWVFNGSAWNDVTGWTTSSTWSWTPTVANDSYIVGVWVRAAGNSIDAPEVSAFVPFPIKSAPPPPPPPKAWMPPPPKPWM
jgi:fibronectin type III domain protein